MNKPLTRDEWLTSLEEINEAVAHRPSGLSMEQERGAEPPPPTPEDEEFQRLEQKLKSEQDRRVEEYLRRAQAESVRLVELHAAELPLMTLRKAFELGWRAGYSDALRREKLR